MSNGKISSITANQFEVGDTQEAHITVGDVLEALEDVLSAKERAQYEEWFGEQYGDVSEIIPSIENLAQIVSDAFSGKFPLETLNAIIEILNTICT